MRTSRKHVLAALMASGVVGATSPVALAAIEVAENLLISLDASTLAPGTINTWSNAGSLLGEFRNDALAPSSSVQVGTIRGSTAAIFTGNDALVSTNGVDTLGPIPLYAPAGLVGIDPTRTIEVWAYNPGIAGEETMVSWSRRGGVPDGSAMQFNYGSNGTFGAATHWGAPDIGWGGAANVPVRGTWHHLAYTFNGAEGGGTTPTTRVYVDGVQANQEVLAPGAINTHTPYEFRLGAALAGNEAGLEIFGSLALARVRVHDGVLSPTQILNNFNEEKVAFDLTPPQPAQAAPLQRGPKHRYSFDGTGGDGTALTDSVGGAHGVLRALDASTLTGTGQMSLAGGASATAGYGDLPNNLISTLTELTLEAWVTPQGAQNWMRIADFGSTTEGELMGPGGGGNGADYIFMSATRGTNLNQKRAEIRDAGAPGGVARLNTADVTVTTTAGQEQHYAVVYSTTSEFGVPELRLYVNGQLVSSTNTEITLAELNDINNWLGRSNYTGDANFQGSFEEFRIYDYALTSGELLGNFEAGANTINTASLWNRDANGNWSEATNWSGSVPNAVDASAMLGSAITAPRQIDLDVPVSLGSLRFAGNHGYEVRGAAGLTMDVAPGKSAVLSAAGPANHLISAPVTLADDTAVEVATPTATLTLSSLNAAPAARLTKRGQGTLAVNRVRAAALDVAAGKVRILTGGGQEGVSVVNDLIIAGATDNWTGTLDLADNDLVVRADAANRDVTLARIVNQIKHGRDTGASGRWSGAGITSSNAAQDPITGLAAMPNPGLDTFSGQTVGANDVLVKYTYNGDANLDGRINADDYFQIDSGFLDQPANPTYRQGDFNYDGKINADDYFQIDSAFLEQGAPIASGAAAAALVSVPEPGSMAGVMMFAALATSRSLGTRCRRRRA
jgi:hypothetical protein